LWRRRYSNNQAYNQRKQRFLHPPTLTDNITHQLIGTSPN
jgi:hypothetical protein